MCEVGKLIPIVYGMPSRGLIEQSERGEIELGGCVVSQVLDPEIGLVSGDPELSCPACEGRFYRNCEPDSSGLSRRTHSKPVEYYDERLATNGPRDV